MEIPKHQKVLSIIYWKMVEGLEKNGFSRKMSEEVISNFFHNFCPTPTFELPRD